MDFIEWGEHAHLDCTHFKAGGRFVQEYKKTITPHIIKDIYSQVRDFITETFPYLRSLHYYQQYDAFNFVCAIGEYIYCYKTKQHANDLLIKDMEELNAPNLQIVAKWLTALYTPQVAVQLMGATMWSTDPYFNVSLPEQRVSSLFGRIVENCAIGIALLELIKVENTDNLISILEIMYVCKKFESKLKRLALHPPGQVPLNLKMIYFVYDTNIHIV